MATEEGALHKFKSLWQERGTR